MSWPRITDLLITDGPAEIGLIGVPMNLGAVTPGHYDRAPAVIRQALRRFSRYDVETGQELALSVRDHGDVDVARLSLEAGFGPVCDAVQSATGAHELTLVLGGHNGATRPAVHGLGLPLDKVGLITLDAHFDLRDTDGGLLNGNPVRALLEDGLPGANICQIGLAPFANTVAMHGIARRASDAPCAPDQVRGAEDGGQPFEGSDSTVTVGTSAAGFGTAPATRLSSVDPSRPISFISPSMIGAWAR
jgi:arginase family enzyme